MNIAEPIAKKFSNSILNYLRLWQYFTRRIEHSMAGRATHRPSSCQEFYNHVAFGDIKDGDRIVLKEFFGTDWIPRDPGACASRTRAGEEGQKSYSSLVERTKCFTHNLIRNNWRVPGLGSFRLPLVEQEYRPIGVVTAGEYLTDLGIIVIVSKSVYSQFLSRQHRFDAVEVDLEGFVSFSYPSSSRLSVANKSERHAFDPVIVVDSPLQVKFRTHVGHPRINAALFRLIRYSEPPILGMTGEDVEYGEKVDLEMLCSSMSNCDPDELASVALIASQMVPGTVIESEREPATASEFADFVRMPASMERKQADDQKIKMNIPLSSAQRRRFIEIYRGLTEGKALEESEEPKSEYTLEEYDITQVQILTEFDGRNSILRPTLPMRILPETDEQSVALARELIQEAIELEPSIEEEKPSTRFESDED